MTRTALTPDRAVYPGDLCYHGERLVSILSPEEDKKVWIAYIDNPPTFNIEKFSPETPEGLVPCKIPNADTYLINKTDLSDLTYEEKQGLWLYGTKGR